MPVHIEDLSTEVTLDEGDTELSDEQIAQIALRVAERIKEENASGRDLEELTSLLPQSKSFLKITDPTS